MQTTSAGFVIQNLSIAVLINRAALAAALGGDKATPDALTAQIKEVEQLVSSAAGLDKKRGDVVKISVVDFVDASHDLEPAPSASFTEIFARQTGSLVNAAAIVLVAAMLLWFGVRPGLRMLLAPPAGTASGDDASTAETTPALAAPETMMIESGVGRDEFLEMLLARRDNGPERKLTKLIDFDENQAAAVIKRWIRQGANG